MKKKTKSNEEIIEKQLGEYQEIIDFAKDPIIHLFYQHIKAGLMSYSNPNQSSEDRFNSYLQMLRIAEALLGQKFNFDFVDFRKKIKNKHADKTDQLLKEIKKVAELLDSRTRKINISIVFRKTKNAESEKEESAIS